MNRVVSGVRDPALSVVITERRALWYSDGASPDHDRPAHVRAGSSLAAIGDKIVVIQDDANFLALVDPKAGRVDPVMLPRGDGGVRQFDDLRGNKDAKLDLEACVVIERDGMPELLAFGSGSTDRRERVVRVRGIGGSTPVVEYVDAAKLYGALRAAEGFAPGRMNLEGVVATPDGNLWFLSRGNGDARDGTLPVNGVARVELSALLDHLADPYTRDLPRIPEVFQLDLGSLDGVPLGVTDGISWKDGILLTASAEASPNAVDDGPVTGSALAFLGPDDALRWAPILDENGAVAAVKVEGVVELGGDHYAIVDGDDPLAPSTLLILGTNLS